MSRDQRRHLVFGSKEKNKSDGGTHGLDVSGTDALAH